MKRKEREAQRCAIRLIRWGGIFESKGVIQMAMLSRAQELVNMAHKVADDLRAAEVSQRPITVAELVDAIEYCVPADETNEYGFEDMARDILERIRSQRESKG